MKWTVLDDYDALSERAAEVVLDAVDRNPRSRLGLPTGRTPRGMYRELVSRCRTRYHCFTEIETFNLDEYVGIPVDHPGSYASFMATNFLDHVDVSPDNVHIPTGDPELLRARFGETDDIAALLARECEWYDAEVSEGGGLDLIVLGVGRNGHIAFNEPGTSFESRTHVVRLDESTRSANAGDFPGEDVPLLAITMGLATILESRKVLLLASGKSKRDPLERLLEGEKGQDLPVSILRDHPDVEILTDAEANPLDETR